MSLGWQRFAEFYWRLGAPMRPGPGDAEAMARAIADRDGRVVLLGVTPQLADIGQDLTAVDASAQLIEAIWPGDTTRRRAVVGDWLNLPCENAAVDSVIGDGSLNSLVGDHHDLFAEVRRVLSDGGIAAFRSFCAPDRAERLQDICDEDLGGWQGNFHAFKWRIAMALAARNPTASIPVAEVRDAFDRHFPDREALSALTGWPVDDIATIDAYDGATHSMFFPTLGRLLEMGARHFGHVEALARDGYVLADRCPVVVFR